MPDHPIDSVAPTSGLVAAKKVVAWSVLAIMTVSVVALIVGALVAGDTPGPPIGRLSEPAGELPLTVPQVRFVDATAEFGVAYRVGGSFSNPMAGGVAAVDIDADGRVDLAVAHGDLAVMRATTTGFAPARVLRLGDAVSVTASDIDLDGHPDLLIARTGSNDTIVWGGRWAVDGSVPTTTDLPGARPSNQLLAGDVFGDSAIDIVRIGSSRGPSDAIWTGSVGSPREFVRTPLPGGDRISLTGELADVDADGLLDIWINRDVGWDVGPDAVFSRRGQPAGPWVDIAAELGVDLRIDGMGLTLADLDGNGGLDAYVSDLGDNEVLMAVDGGFEPAGSVGAARIRPPGSPDSVVSSSWASGAADFNLDGILDLVVVNGGFPDGGVRNKIPGTSVAVVDPPAIMLGTGNGTYVDVWSSLGLSWSTADRGMAIVDLDADGDDDIVTIGVDGTITILRNDASGSSVAVSVGSGCDTAGVVFTALSEAGRYERLLAPHSYGGSHSPVAVVGVPEGSSADVSIRTVDGFSESERISVSGRESLTLACPGGG